MSARPTMSVWRPFAVLLALLLLCSGCGSGGAEPSQGESRSYRDAKGRELTLPARPERIVALSEPTLDNALALGVRPIATTAGRGQGTISAYLQDRARGIASVGILGQPSIERVAALRPDVILIDGTATQDPSIVDKLERIAPTVYVSRTGADWRVAFSALADVLGRGAEGRAALARFDRRVEQVRSRLGANAGAQVSIVRWGGIGLPAVIMRELASSRVVAQLGLRRPPFQDRRGPGHSVPVSLERLEDLDGDWIFFGALGAGGAEGGVSETPADVAAARQAIANARQTPGFQRLRAVRAGHVVPVDGSAWTSAGGMLAEQVVVDDVERTLATGAP